MKLFGYEVFAEKKTTRSLPSGVELGGSGTEMWDGIITEEYNTELRGTEGFKNYDKMRRNDATVKSAVLAVTLPIRRAKWYVQPASDSPEDMERADFIQWNLFDGLSSTYDDFIRQACLHLVFGNMVFEKVFNVRTWEGKDMVTWEKFGPRLPRTIAKWETKDKQGIEQLLHDGRQVIIPWEKLMVFVNEMEGDNWEGISILRAAYKHWYYKDKFYLIDAMAFERQGLGIPKAKLQEGASQDDTDKAKAILKNIRANHQQYIVEPFDVTLEFMDMKANTTRDPEKSIAHHNREITKSVLAQFLELGATDSGSRALSEDQSSLFLLSLETVANNIRDVINRFAIKQLIDLNYNGVQYYPTLEYAGINRVDVQKLAGAYEVLTRSGGIKSQGEDERYLREVMGLPERDIEEDEDTEEPEDKENKDPEDLPKEEDSKKKEASFPHRFEDEYRSWRPLTFAEKKVAFGALEKEIDRLERSLVNDASEILKTEKDKYIKALSAALHSNDPSKAKEVKFKAATAYAKVLRDHQRGALTYGKTSAASEMGKAIPATTAEQKALIDMQSAAIADSHVTTLDEKAKIAAVNARTRGETVAIAVAAADKAAEETIEKLLKDTSRIVVSGYINSGRNYVHDTYQNEVYALQRSELLDSHTCFPAGTKIHTASGMKNIEDVKTGESVLTTQGYRNVVTTMDREYVGSLVHVQTGKSSFVCTEDHPVFANGKWVKARYLSAGDSILYARTYVGHKIVTLIHKLFRQSDYFVTLAEKVGIFSRVPLLVTMPIVSVGFYTNIQALNEEVYGVSAYTDFLSKLKTGLFESFTHLLFKLGFATVFTVAGNGAKPSMFGGWRCSLGLSALNACVSNERSTADLRTEVRAVSAPSPKYRSTSITRLSDLLGSFTRNRATIVSFGIRPWYRKLFSADHTYLIDPSACRPACNRTKHTTVATSFVVHGKIKTGIADNTFSRFASLTCENFKITLTRTVFRFARWVGLSFKNLVANCTNHQINYNTFVNNLASLRVYNIEVEDRHEYFANGILVHNCNYCLSVDGRIIEKTDTFGKAGIFHSGCRGVWVSILQDEAEKPSITGVPKSLRDKYGDAVNELVQPKNPTNTKDSAAKDEIDKRKK